MGDLDACLSQLLSDCRDIMTDPRPEMTDWGAYFRLIEFKLSASLPEQAAKLVDSVLLHMRGQLAPIVRSQLGRWQLLRLNASAGPPLRMDDRLYGDVSSFLEQCGAGEALSHGTIRGLLAPIYHRGLCPDFRPGWPRVATGAPGCALVANWREAEVHAVMAHLSGPQHRVVPGWQPVVLRIPIEATHLDIKHVCAQCGRIFVREAVTAAGAQVWLVGDDPRPHWQPLGDRLVWRTAPASPARRSGSQTDDRRSARRRPQPLGGRRPAIHHAP